MHSRVDRWRVAAEWTLRAVALAAVAFALVRAWAAGNDGAAAPARLEWTAMPSPVTRDSLAALRRAGTAVTWRGPALEALAVSATLAPAPDGSVRIAAVGPGDVVLSDASGARDTLRNAAAGAVMLMPAPVGEYVAQLRNTRATVRASSPDSARAILVVGRASWETKFTMAALEEAGWHVQARVAVAPGAEVRQGAAGAAAARGASVPSGALDRHRYAAVVALDSTVDVLGAALARYVREGGGLVLAGDAPDAAVARALAPGRAGTRIASGAVAFDAAQPLRSLAVRPVTSLRADAVVLERRGPLVLAAARREGAGRVVQSAYEELWRWRMQGGDDARSRHRAWWTRTVAAAVSPATADPFTAANPEGAPLARLEDALGPPSVGRAPAAPRSLPGWLLPLVFAILLVEWGSRRFRGAR